VICAEAIPWLASMKLAESQAAVRRGDGNAAFSAAVDAKRIQPWAASPYLQLALVDEASGDLASARRWIGDAIERDRENWRLWLVAARLETKAGDVATAERALERAASLNPRSPLFADLARNRP
jgi:Tfp pilus assembly protein PilF